MLYVPKHASSHFPPKAMSGGKGTTVHNVSKRGVTKSNGKVHEWAR